MNQSVSDAIGSAIGVDIGGTKIAVALVGTQGTILGREVLATEAELGFGRAMDRLSGAIERLLAKVAKATVTGIGIGCAGPLDPLLGLINNPYTLSGWDRCDAVTPLRRRFGVPVYLENDADVAAFGECACGAGAGSNPVVMLTLGTGVGGAAVVGGELYRGVGGEHPELGHLVVAGEGPNCYCGARGCLESIASGAAIAAAGSVLGYSDTRAVFAAAEVGEERAKVVVDRAMAATATAAWTLCHTFLPQVLILGGGMMDHHFDRFASAVRQRLSMATQFTRDKVTVLRACLGNDAGMVGAGMLAMRRAGQ